MSNAVDISAAFFNRIEWTSEDHKAVGISIVNTMIANPRRLRERAVAAHLAVYEARGISLTIAEIAAVCHKFNAVTVGKARGMLNQPPPLRNARNSGRTWLHVACAQNDEIMVKILLEWGAGLLDLDALDSNGNTALHLTNDRDVIKPLLDAGANGLIRNNVGILSMIGTVVPNSSTDGWELVFPSFEALDDFLQRGPLSHVVYVHDADIGLIPVAPGMAE